MNCEQLFSPSYIFTIIIWEEFVMSQKTEADHMVWSDIVWKVFVAIVVVVLEVIIDVLKEKE